jgi:hypothetical protein
VVVDVLISNVPNFTPLTNIEYMPGEKLPSEYVTVNGCITVIHASVGSYRLYTSRLITLLDVEVTWLIRNIWHGSGKLPTR